MFKKRFLPWLLLLLVSLIFALTGCEEKSFEEPVAMTWGIPEEVTAFESLPREPQGIKVEEVKNHIVQVTWEVGESYILPITAVSNRELPGVRYQGSGVPEHIKLEWIDPRQEEWFPIEELPEGRVKAIIEQQNDSLTVDFGPPEGANFDEGMTRLIWFRITPSKAEKFEFNIFGYQMKEGEPDKARISNVITLQAEVIE